MSSVSDASSPRVAEEGDRQLGFEAKKFALETLVKIYLEQSNGSRALVMSHARVMLTLSLAAMAGLVTVSAAMVRGESPQTVGWMQPLPVAVALSGFAFLVASALWASKALSLAAKAATKLLQDPFPTAHKELEEMFDAKHEDIVLDRLVATVQLHIADTAPTSNSSVYATVALVAGLTLAGASFVFPFVAIGN